MNWKTGTILALVVSSGTLAYYVGNRLSTDALNLAVGVLCGMGASIPVSLGLLLALLRQREPAEEQVPEQPTGFRDFHPTTGYATRPAQPQQPQIIVIAPPQSQYPGQPNYGYPAGPAGYANFMPSMNEEVIDGRDWRIIGDDEG